MIKKITAVLYVLIIVLMATASVIENYKGTPFTHQYIYGSWWFSLTWALLTGFGTAYIQRVGRSLPLEAKGQEMGCFVASSFVYRYPCRRFAYAYAVV